MTYVLGIDGGGTKTVCVLMDAAGQVLGRGEAGPSNYQSLGMEAAGHSIVSAMTQAAPPQTPIHGICLGLAGVGRPKDVQVVQNWLHKIQSNSQSSVTWSLQPHGIVICGDSITALTGGLGHPVGIAVIAGTGSQILGQNSQGQTQRVGGWGYLLGDEGSGYDIAIQGLKAALRSYDGRLASTRLVEVFQQHLQLNHIEELVEVVYRRGWGVKEIAALAPLVDQVAAQGDQVAIHIIETAVGELVLATKILLTALFSPQESIDIVTIGGVWRGVANLRRHFEAAMMAHSPLVKVVWPRYEPACGAGLLALKALHQSANTE